MTKTIFYPLTDSEWLEVWDILKPAEIKVLFYLRTLNPWGDRNLEVKVTDIANTLKLNKSTVSRALTKLNSLGYIALQIETASVRLTSKALPTDNSDDRYATALPTDNSDDRYTTRKIATQQERSLRNSRRLKRLSDKGSRPSHTYSDFKQTFSYDRAREESEVFEGDAIATTAKTEPEPARTEIVPLSVNQSEAIAQANTLNRTNHSAPANSLDEKLFSADPEEVLQAELPLDWFDRGDYVNKAMAQEIRMRAGRNAYPWKQGRATQEAFAEYIANTLGKDQSIETRRGMARGMICNANSSAPGSPNYTKVLQRWVSFTKNASTATTIEQATAKQSRMSPVMEEFFRRRREEKACSQV